MTRTAQKIEQAYANIMKSVEVNRSIAAALSKQLAADASEIEARQKAIITRRELIQTHSS